jgi:hypothetical protein
MMDHTPTTYEAPTITRVGSVADLTQGGTPDIFGDGQSFRGPSIITPPTS